MGAKFFTQRAQGPDAESAFRYAVCNAQYEYGHRGYTGTIAEKSSFIVCNPANTIEDAELLANVADRKGELEKWGPAWCIQIRDTDTYLFFGVSPC